MRNILHLQDWQVTEVHEIRQDLVIEAVYGPIPEACPKCGVVGEIYKHGKKLTDFRDAPVRGKPVIIRCDRQRYRCQACKELPVSAAEGVQPMRMLSPGLRAGRGEGPVHDAGPIPLARAGAPEPHEALPRLPPILHQPVVQGSW